MARLLGGKRWTERSPYDDDYTSEEDEEMSPLDDDYVKEEYRNGPDDNMEE